MDEGPIERRREHRGDVRGERPDAPVMASPSDEPDVLLHVPTLKVEEISLDVEQLHARVSLRARVGNLVELDAGVDVEVGQVKLGIKGVDAQAELKVRLEHVYRIIDRALATLERNPEVVERVLEPVGETLRDVERSIGPTVSDLGGAVAHTVERAAGDLGEAAAATVGGVANEAEREVSSPGARETDTALPTEEPVRSIGRVALEGALDVVDLFGRTVRGAANTISRRRKAG